MAYSRWGCSYFYTFWGGQAEQQTSMMEFLDDVERYYQKEQQ